MPPMLGPVRSAVAWSAIVAVLLLWGGALAPREVPGCSMRAPRPSATVQLALLPVMVPAPPSSAPRSVAPASGATRASAESIDGSSAGRPRPESPPPRLLG